MDLRHHLSERRRDFVGKTLKQIIDGGYCIGCGVCAPVASIPVVLDRYGMFQADRSSAAALSDEALKRALLVCPFSNDGPNEDDLGMRLFGDSGQHDASVGYYESLYIGHVAEGKFREKGTSGGIITWMLTELLQTGRVDAVCHVKKVDHPDDGLLFRYGISRTPDEIIAGAKSRYYPVEISQVLEQIRTSPGRYAVVGLPCFVKAVRRLAAVDPCIKERVVFYVGLVCGHLKSKAFADCFGWQAGIPPGELREIDFRVKLPGRAAGDYGVYLRGVGQEVTRPSREFLGSNWGHNFFRYPACDFCDDVFAETADVAIGDAWLPEYVSDPKGNSIIVVRNRDLECLVGSAREKMRLTVARAKADQIAASQSGGLRDRREGLAYRLHLRKKRGEWAPQKRIEPDHKHLAIGRERIYQARSESGAQSHRLWQKALEQRDLRVFRIGMQPYVQRVQPVQPRWRAFAVRVFRRLNAWRARVV